MQQQRLQQLQQQQQARQALMAQQAAYNMPGMQMGGIPLNQMTPAQVATLRSRMPVVLPPHLQQAQFAQQQQNQNLSPQQVRKPQVNYLQQFGLRRCCSSSAC